jgi:translation initiation factor 4A
MAPTHELARQHQNVCNSIGHYCKVRTHLLIGGTSIESDKNALTGEEKPHVVFACPGRLHDMLRRGYLDPKKITIMCLDEADELLSSCFKEQLYHIIQFMNNDMQIAIFSATMPEEVKELTSRFMQSPHSIYMNKDDLPVEAISQFYIALETDQQKFEVVKDIFAGVTISQTIIYCNSVKRVQDLTDALKQDGFPVSCIHSNFTEDERKEIIKEFAQGKSRVLVSSDITARGIDIPQVNVVINFDLCKCQHKYLHRIGRSGRWGRKGVAINFITRRDQAIMKEFESYYGIVIQPFPTDYTTELKRLT